MTKSGITTKTFAIAIFALALCATTQAQTRTFVSGTGSDANACNRASPCRSFQRALNVVVDGGEVIAVDSAGYGPVTITKSVSIIGDGGYAGINTPSGDGVTIATAGIKVNLRSLTIAGLDTATNGIHVTSVGTLHVEGCVISGFTNGAILVELAAEDSQVFIKETVARNNGFGIFLSTSTGTVRGSIDNCRAERNNGGGFAAYLNSRVTVNRSVASGNGGPGFDAISDVSGVTAELSCEERISSNNGSGFQVETNTAGAAATIRVSHSTASHNQSGFNQTNDGVFESLKNNLVAGNGTDIAGTITPITAQ